MVALWFHLTTICLTVWPLLFGLPEHARLVASHDCLLLLGIALTSFSAQLMMTRSFQITTAARAAAVGFTGQFLFLILVQQGWPALRNVCRMTLWHNHCSPQQLTGTIHCKCTWNLTCK